MVIQDATPTVLDRNDTPGFGNRTDNSYHVVTTARNGRANLHGLTIRGGQLAGATVGGDAVLVSEGTIEA